MSRVSSILLKVVVVVFSCLIACKSRQPIVQLTQTRYIHDTVRTMMPYKPSIPPPVSAYIDTLLYAVHEAGSPNFNLRKPNYVIIHHTAQDSCAQTFKTFQLARTQVSSHYVICKDGSLHHLLNDYLRAWHAGISRWGNNTDINSSSIGIELDNNGSEPFSTPQINTLLQLLDTLKRVHSIPTANFIGHGDVAPIRKNDPSIFFPWKLLAQKGFGFWYDDTLSFTTPVDSAFNALHALRIIGYSMKDTTKAIIAFKRHFRQDTMPGMSEFDKKVLYNLYKKYF